MASEKLGIEFVIDGAQSNLVKQKIPRIQHLFNVKIFLKDFFPMKKDNYVKQWIHILGPKELTEAAKNYIIALTTPEHQQCIKDLRHYLTANMQDEIERTSHAALTFKDGSGDLFISGSQLSVTVVQSLIDDILKDSKLDHNYDSKTVDKTLVKRIEPDLVAKDNNNSALNSIKTLQKVQSEPGPLINYSVYASPSVLSPVSSCGQANKERNNSASSGTFYKASSYSSQQNGKMDNFKQTSQSHASAQARSLWQLAQNLHYPSEDIEQGLSMYDMNSIVVPVDFFNTLNNIKANRHCRTNTGILNGTEVKRTPCLDVNDSVICLGEEDNIITISDDDIEIDNEATNSSGLAKCDRDATGGGQMANCSVQTLLQQRKENTCEDKTVPCKQYREDLRYIVVDGSNVAMAHGENRIFSVNGIAIVVQFFRQRGHDRITVFVSECRRYGNNREPIRNKSLLEKLHDDGIVKFTPARRVDGKAIVSYDDRYILNLALKEDAVIVSNDQFRDLCSENVKYKNLVETNLLQFLFVGDTFMPPDDPFGRRGPRLDVFLKTPQKELSLPMNATTQTNRQYCTGQMSKKKPERSQELTKKLYDELIQVFPNTDQSMCVCKVLQNHVAETDLVKLTNYVIDALST